MKKMKISLILMAVVLIVSGCGQEKKAVRQENTNESTRETTAKKAKKTEDAKSMKKIEELKKAKQKKAKEKKDNDDTEESSEGGISAETPDFSYLTRADIVKELGEPDEKITDSDEIIALLDGEEFNLTISEFKAGKLTKDVARGFAFGTKDLSLAIGMGVKVDAYIYNDSSKPNVYFKDDEVTFMSANTTFESE